MEFSLSNSTPDSGNVQYRAFPDGIHYSGAKKADGSYETAVADDLKIYCRGSDGALVFSCYLHEPGLFTYTLFVNHCCTIN
jgi:hypothetical protein